MSSQTSPHLAQTAAPAESVRARRRLSPDTARVLPVLGPVTLAGAAATVAAVLSFVASGPDAETIVGSLALLVAAAIAEALPVPLEGVAAGRTSLATIFIVAAAALYGWAPANAGRRADDGGGRGREPEARESRRLQHRRSTPSRRRRPARSPSDRRHGSRRARPAGARSRRAPSTSSTSSCSRRSWRAQAASRAPGLLRSYVLDRRAVRGDGVDHSDPRRALGPLAAVAIALVGPLAVIALYERRMYARAQAAARARPAEGRVHRGRLARAAHAARIGLRRGDDAAAARARRRRRASRCSGSSTASPTGSRGSSTRCSGRVAWSPAAARSPSSRLDAASSRTTSSRRRGRACRTGSRSSSRPTSRLPPVAARPGQAPPGARQPRRERRQVLPGRRPRRGAPGARGRPAASLHRRGRGARDPARRAASGSSRSSTASTRTRRAASAARGSASTSAPSSSADGRGDLGATRTWARARRFAFELPRADLTS